MGVIDTLIANASSRAAGYAAATDILVTELRTFIADRGSGLYLPGIKNADGTVTSGLDLSRIIFPTYKAPPKDTTPMPAYEPPNSTLPKKPLLSEIGNVTLPAQRQAPVIKTDNLFKQVAPSPNLPDFNEIEPDLRIDALVAQMDALAAPVISQIEFPDLTPLTLRPTPKITAPDFDPPAAPDALPEPADYAKKYDDTYRRMLPEMQAYVEERVQVYLDTYAPDYHATRSQWQTLINRTMNGGGVLPDQFEQAMYTRARGRSEREFKSVAEGAVTEYSRFGLIQPPGALKAREAEARLRLGDALANQATDIYIKRTEVEVQHLQFVMGQAAGYVDNVRQSVIAVMGVILNTQQQSMAYAAAIAENVARVFEHLIARGQFALAVMKALADQYEVLLKAALADLDVYKLELDAEKAKKDVELAQIQALESKVKVEALQVERYRAMIDAIKAKGELEQLKLKGYEIRADVFKNNTNAKLAAYEVYKAQLQGDSEKLKGELAKLQVYEAQVKTDQLNLEAQIKGVEAAQAVNEARIKTYEVEADVFKLDLEAALKKFTAQAEVKKLAQAVYGQELENAIKQFQADFDAKKILADMLIKQYEMSVNTAIEEAKFNFEKLRIAERASEAAVGAYENMAASALGSLSSVVSQSIQQAA